jgi:hypothetical protein
MLSAQLFAPLITHPTCRLEDYLKTTSRYRALATSIGKNLVCDFLDRFLEDGIAMVLWSSWSRERFLSDSVRLKIGL